MHFQTLPEWLAWLENFKPKPDKAIDISKTEFKLTSVKTIANRLQLLPINKPVMSIAGTNGKGSCVAFAEAIFSAAGYRVGAYYSPHLYKFNERIKIANDYATDEQLCAVFNQINQARENIELTYFEFATLAALLLFQQNNIDIILLEVGLGGRLDTVNIVDADVAIITSIDIDHTEWLGETREKIGFEKAGIFRANKPATCGDENTPNTVREYAKKINTNLFIFNQDFFYKINNNTWSWWNKKIRYDNLPLPKLSVHNAAIILQAITLFPISKLISQDVIEIGLNKAWLAGRFQIISKPILQILDVAHNPAAARELAKKLKATQRTGRTLAVVGILNDKDSRAIFEPLLEIIDEWYLGTLPGPRGSSANQLAENLPNNLSQKIFLFDTIRAAYDAAHAQAQPQDRLVIFGSFYTLGALCLDNAL